MLVTDVVFQGTNKTITEMKKFKIHIDSSGIVLLQSSNTGDIKRVVKHIKCVVMACFC